MANNKEIIDRLVKIAENQQKIIIRLAQQMDVKVPLANKAHVEADILDMLYGSGKLPTPRVTVDYVNVVSTVDGGELKIGLSVPPQEEARLNSFKQNAIKSHLMKKYNVSSVSLST